MPTPKLKQLDNSRKYSSSLFILAEYGISSLFDWGNTSEWDSTSQLSRCIRTNDIKSLDNTHNTFFEMLGNWSLVVFKRIYSMELGVFDRLIEEGCMGMNKERFGDFVRRIRCRQRFGRSRNLEKTGFKTVEEASDEDFREFTLWKG